MNNTQKISEYKQEQADYQDEIFEIDNRISDLEVNAQRLDALLLSIETQLEEVEGIYNIIKTGVIKSAVKEDHMEKNLKHLRSLIEIAQSHNDNNIEA